MTEIKIYRLIPFLQLEIIKKGTISNFINSYINVHFQVRNGI